MQHGTTTRLLSTMASGTYTTRDLIRVSGHSPNTVVRYLRELESRGLIARTQARSPARGRPATANVVTEPGLELLRNLELSAFSKLRREAGVLWGPRRSFSRWGVPFFGRSDVFVRIQVDTAPFEAVVETRPELYDDPFEESSGSYPRLEPFVAWAATRDNPRFLAAIPILLRNGGLDPKELAACARRFRSQNRVGFLASTPGGRPDVLEALTRSGRPERMLAGTAPADRATARMADGWNVRNPVSLALIREMAELYGAPE